MEPITVTLTLSGVRSADRKDGGKLYTADLYLPGAGPFEHNVQPDEFVKLSALPGGSNLIAVLRLGVQDETISYGVGKSFKKKALGIRVMSLEAVPAEHAGRKAS
jgi:hypothetical protein